LVLVVLEKLPRAEEGPTAQIQSLQLLQVLVVELVVVP
jgi:hypothetical protein